MLDLIKRMQSGEAPPNRDTLTDCLLALMPLLVGEYIRGDSPLGVELGHLARVLQDKKDPTVASWSMATRMMVRTQLSQLEALKEKHHARQKAQP